MATPGALPVSPDEFPTIQRLVATPFNETFAYQGPQLCAEARRLMTLYVDVCKCLSEASSGEDQAYLERAYVVAALARLYPSGIRKTDIPGWKPNWHGCVYIDLPAGQISFHYEDSQAPLFAALPAYTRPYDGHSKADVFIRLGLLDGAYAKRLEQLLETAVCGQCGGTGRDTGGKECDWCARAFDTLNGDAAKPDEPLTVARREDGTRLMRLLASAWFHGNWKPETVNEREMQEVMERNGFWPIKDQNALMALLHPHSSFNVTKGETL